MLVRKMQIIRKPRIIAAGVCALACTAALAVPTVAFADDYASKQAEAEAALQSLNTIMARFDEASANYAAALGRQEEAQQQIDEAQKVIEEKTEVIADYQDQLGTRARSMYRGGSASFLDVLFGSSTFDEFATNLDLLNSMNKKDADMVSETKAARKEVEEKQAVLEENKAAYEKEAKELESLALELQNEVASAQAVYDGLSAEAAQILAAQSASNGGGSGAQETVSQNEIASYDESTGQATLSDGSRATVVGYDGNGNAIVQRAYSALGSAYVWGGVGGSAGGYDCSGLVSYALSGSNTRLGTTGTFIGWNQVSDPQPGDVAVVHNGSSQHTGIYIGNGQMIHAADESTGVVIGDVQDGMVFVRP